jgi:hypothetical protein
MSSYPYKRAAFYFCGERASLAQSKFKCVDDIDYGDNIDRRLEGMHAWFICKSGLLDYFLISFLSFF